jgi:hypothetical protein
VFDANEWVAISEKIHGTSAWFTFKDSKLLFHSGGETLETFRAVFNVPELETNLKGSACVQVYGEAYGGKQQKMAHVYGPNLKFVVFDVKINDCWLDVMDAEHFAHYLGLEYVHYMVGRCTVELIEAEMRRESVQALRNGVGQGLEREGVVVRPMRERVDAFGERVIYKHVNRMFSELKTTPKLGERLQMERDTAKILDQWVTPQRLQHVLTHTSLSSVAKVFIPKLVSEVAEDIKRECVNEFEWTPEIEKAIKSAAGKLFTKDLF